MNTNNPLVDSAIYDSIYNTLEWDHSQPWGGCDFASLLDVTLQTLFDSFFPTLENLPHSKRFTREEWLGFYNQVADVWRDFTGTEPDFSRYPFEKMIKHMDLAE